VTWTGCVLAVLFLRWRGLNIDWNTVRYTVPPLLPVVAWALLVGIALQAIYQALVRRDLRGYLKQLSRASWWLLTVRIFLACIVFTYTYFWLKVSVPLVNHQLWDAQLWRVDRLLHFGLSPSIFASRLVAGTPIATGVETWYGWWLPTAMYGTGFFVALPDDRQRSAFVLSTVTIWYAGAWLYTALPALGPCYAFSDVWEHLRSQFPRASAAQRMLWENYQKMLAGRTGPLRQFNPTRGIAALPSLHVGIHALLTLWTWRLARPLFVLGILATLFTFFGSLATGWHYAVDGYVGVLLAFASFLIALRASGFPLRPSRTSRDDSVLDGQEAGPR